MATTYLPIANSAFLDFAGYGITSATTVESAYGITDGSLKLSFYRVDDVTGSIGGIAPGAVGYEAAATARTYVTSTGAASIEAQATASSAR